MCENTTVKQEAKVSVAELPYELICRQCGNPFRSKGINAFYCFSCKDARKKDSDRQSWLRRKARDGIYSSSERRKMAMLRKEKSHAEELGLSESYYDLWRICNIPYYKEWMHKHLPPELLPHGKERRGRCK